MLIRTIALTPVTFFTVHVHAISQSWDEIGQHSGVHHHPVSRMAWVEVFDILRKGLHVEVQTVQQGIDSKRLEDALRSPV